MLSFAREESQHRMKTWLVIIVTAAALAAALAACRATGEEAEAGVVVTCGASLGLAPKDNLRKDWSGEVREWSATTAGDTLLLVRRGQCGDECNYVEQISFTGLASSCPQLLRASSTRVESGSPIPGAGGKVVEARTGTLELQDWNPSGVVSGRLTAEFSTTFYVNLVKEP